MRLYAPNPTPTNGKIEINKPTVNPSEYFNKGVDWVVAHGTLVGTIVACLFFAYIFRSVWTKLPKSVVIVLVIVLLIGAGYLDVKRR